MDGSQAAREAAAAADAAQVEVVEAKDEQASRRIVETGELVWGPRGTLAPNELRALSFAGNPVHLALDRRHPDRPVVGFAVGFVGWTPALHVHSHQVGVVPGHRRRGVGYALKLAQRRTCLEHDVTSMRWTFDPLVRRNASFNLNALGARAESFYVDFYGTMNDTINAGDASDRLVAVWDLRRPLAARGAPAAAVTSTQPAPVLLEAVHGRPVVHDRAPVAGAVICVPDDYDALRAGDPERAHQWRLTLRQVLARVYEAGFWIGAVDSEGYRLVPEEGS